MWPQFIAGFFITLIVLFVPGTLQLFVTRVPRHLVLPFAPMVSIAELCLLGTALGLAGCSVSGIQLIVALLIVSIIVFIVRWIQMGSSESVKTPSSRAIANQVFYVCFALAVTALLYVLPLDGPDSFAQMFDNGFHLNLISAFIDTGRFSILQATQFPSEVIKPLGDIAFYPAAWHIVAAVVGSAIHSTAALAENVANVAFVAIVFPLGMYSFVQKLFGDNIRVHVCGAICTVAFTAFPWGFLAYGPLYSNLAAFAILPAAMSCFIWCIEAKHKLSLVVTFIVSVVALACSQPNAIFTAVVILTPYCMIKIYQGMLAMGKSRTSSIACSTAFLLFVIAIWLFCRSLSFFDQIVNYAWKPYTGTLVQAFIDYLDLGYRNTTAQVLLAIMVIVGIVRSLASRSRRWLIIPYVYFCLAYVVGGALEGGWLFGSVLSGYWYNDIDRIAASSVLVMVPLALYGLEGIASVCEVTVGSQWTRGRRGVVFSSVIILCAFIVYLPNFILAGRGDVVTAFGERYERFNELATVKSLTEEEVQFLEKCKQEVGDSVVANFPFDGSVYAFSLTDLHTLYRHYFAEGAPEYQLIQQKMDQVATNDEVKNAVKSLKIEYVVLLDSAASGDSAGKSIYQPFADDPADPNGTWGGLVSITDDTPGFELVLADGDMRLYRVL